MRFLAILVFCCTMSTTGLGQQAPQKQPPENRNCKSVESEGSKSGRAEGREKSKLGPCEVAPVTAPSAAEKFPYPGEVPPPKAEVPEAIPALAPQSPGAAKQFPYPGESSSSSSTSSSDSGDPGATSHAPGAGDPGRDDRGSNGNVRRKLPKPERIQSDEDREAEDLSVAEFYRKSGDLQAAYLRAKDAVKMQPADPAAHFALADIAKRLKKTAEAAAEYQAYLKLEPDGDQVRAAQKALGSLR